VTGSACSSKANLVGQGGQCEVATDCDEGLACVPDKSGNRTCTSDLSGVQKTPDMPADSGPATDGSGDDAPATMNDAPSTNDSPSPPQDSAGPDTSTQPDTSTPVDSATE
jgi:hypothetical protein